MSRMMMMMTRMRMMMMTTMMMMVIVIITIAVGHFLHDLLSSLPVMHEGNLLAFLRVSLCTEALVAQSVLFTF